MELIIPKEKSNLTELNGKVEVLSFLELKVKELIDSHILKRKLWFPNDFLPADEQMNDDQEKNIKELEPNIKTVIIPNGAGDEMIVKKIPKKNINPPTLLFQGNFYWLQNVEAADFLTKKIYPKLIKTHPEIKIIISGQKANKIKSKKGIEIINLNLNDSKKVKKIYQRATIFVAPIFGPGGTRLKILAAMAAGVPVISTKVGVEGLSVKDGRHILLANNPEEFIEKINLLLKEKNLYQTIQKNAYQLIKNEYSWFSIAKKLENVYQQII